MKIATLDNFPLYKTQKNYVLANITHVHYRTAEFDDPVPFPYRKLCSAPTSLLFQVSAKVVRHTGDEIDDHCPLH